MSAADRHPPEYVLAELAEGVLEDGTSTVSEHVRGCPSCQSVLDQLTEVTRLLRTTPDRVPMPAHVTARIAAALNEEAIVATAARERAEQEARAADAGASGASGAAGPVGWFRRRLPIAVAAAAATAFIGFFGYTLINDDSPPEMATSSGAADREFDTDDRGADTDDEAGGEDTENEENAPGDGPGVAEPGPLGENLLERTILDVWNSREQVQPGCGQGLADAQGSDLVGSTEFDGDVLVVLESDQLTGWVVGDCESSVGGETPDVAVPLPQE
ncbi:hypothetical protein [Phytoactinopolyspora halotolerans]|uniref:Zf-HC2 domain-containing protein n=1 Tax=Phytoactinopolyspora halotolerans TaxID=1981512 RepID=A0A6L9S146_9ACTN|nr:hypothetical protein [Phytoactinopolyspora halotolerans]NED98688.1 hypothetical protein [Phytoactinopolyspora halotolerans]